MQLTTLFYVPWYTLHNDGLLQLTTPSKVVLPPWLFRQEICSHWIFNSAPKGIFWRQEIWVLKGRKKKREFFIEADRLGPHTYFPLLEHLWSNWDQKEAPPYWNTSVKVCEASLTSFLLRKIFNALRFDDKSNMWLLTVMLMQREKSPFYILMTCPKSFLNFGTFFSHHHHLPICTLYQNSSCRWPCWKGFALLLDMKY